MRQIRTLVPLLLILVCTPASLSHSQVPTVPTLPSVTAYALDRAKVTLPADFATPLNLLILFFPRDQEAVVDNWIPVVDRSEAPKVQIWLLPVSQRANGLYRWWLNASFRGTQASTLPRRYTVPLYVDKRQFLGALQVPSEQEVVILLSDRTGRVLWRAEGPATDSKKAELRDFVTRWTPR
jgi:hypothetical protein